MKSFHEPRHLYCIENKYLEVVIFFKFYVPIVIEYHYQLKISLMKVIASIFLTYFIFFQLYAHKASTCQATNLGNMKTTPFTLISAALPFSGIGSINLGGALWSSNFISGVEFTLVDRQHEPRNVPHPFRFRRFIGSLNPNLCG